MKLKVQEPKLTTPLKMHKPIFTNLAFKEREDTSTTSEESSSLESSSSFSPADDSILIEEISGCQCKHEVLALKRRNFGLEREMRNMNRHMMATETQKLEMLNRCNFLEQQVSKNARNVCLIKALRTEFTKMHEKKAETEADFMNQLSTLSMVMRQKEMNHQRILSEKQDIIFFLESKVAAYKILECESSRTEEGKDENDQSLNDRMQKFSISQDKETNEYLSTALKQSREKNADLSDEITNLQELVNNLEMKVSKVTRLESELEDTRMTVSTFKRANTLLSSLDTAHEKELCRDLLNSSREEDQFMKELQALESDMNADLKDLQENFMNEKTIITEPI